MARRILGMERPSQRFKTQNKTFVSRKKTEVPNTNTLEIRKQKKKNSIYLFFEWHTSRRRGRDATRSSTQEGGSTKRIPSSSK